MTKSHISLRNTLINSSGTLLSRLTGIIKQIIPTYLFGAGADPFFGAFRIVNSFRRYIGEGSMTNSFIPVYQKEEDKDLFASNVLNLFFIINTIITIIGVFLSPLYFPYLTIGFKKGSLVLEQAIILNAIMFPYIIFISFYAIGMGILNSNKRFFSGAFAPVAFNIVNIFLPLVIYKSTGIYSLGISLIVGSIVMDIMILIELKLSGFKYRFYLNLKDKALKDFFKLYIPNSANMIFITLKNLLTTQFLTFWIGALTIYFNIFTIIEAPLGIVAIAIGGVILPVLSKLKNNNDTTGFEKTIIETFYILLYLTIPITLFFIFFPDLIVNSIFIDLPKILTGRVSNYIELSSKTSLGLSIYSLAIIPMSFAVIFEKIFYSLHKPKVVLMANVVTFFICFIFYFLSLIPVINFYGVIIADVISCYAIFIYFLIKLNSIILLNELLSKLKKLIIYSGFISIIITILFYNFVYIIYKNNENSFLRIFISVLIFIVYSFLYFLICNLAGIRIRKRL